MYGERGCTLRKQDWSPRGISCGCPACGRRRLHEVEMDYFHAVGEIRSHHTIAVESQVLGQWGPAATIDLYRTPARPYALDA